MYSSFLKFFIPISLILLLLSAFLLNNYSQDSNYTIPVSNSFYWPLPGNRNITSQFGKRHSPTSGASSYHSGIDIAASEGTSIYSCIDGKVIFAGFKGAGGCTITVQNGDISISYCHISPNYLFRVGEYVSQKNIIAKVGPKNIYGILNNPYKDSSGNPTNGATTGCHLHLTIRKDGKAVNPLSYF